MEMTGKIPVLTNITAGQVYRNRLTDPLFIPAAQVLAHLFPDETIQIINETGFFQRANKICRLQTPQFSMSPAAESLCADDFPCCIINLGLIPYFEIFRLDGSRQVIDHFRNMFSFFPLLRIIKRIIDDTAAPDFLLRHTGIVQHAVYINIPEVLRRQNINPAAYLNLRFPSLADEIVLHRIDYVLLIQLHLLFALNSTEYNKTIAGDPPHRFFIRKILHGFVRPEFEKLVPSLPAKAVIDKLEVPDIVIREEIRRIRMRPQQFLYPLPESAYTEQSGQRVVIHQPVQPLLLFHAEGALFLHENNNQGSQEEYCQKNDKSVFIKVIENVIPVQLPRRVIQNNSPMTQIAQRSDAAVQSFNNRPPFRSIQRAGPEIYRKHGRRLNCQIRIGRFL